MNISLHVHTYNSLSNNEIDIAADKTSSQ